MVASLSKGEHLKARLKPGVRVREDELWGGICYVPHRDDFFAANKQVFSALQKLTNDWRSFGREWKSTFVALAKLGICETQDPATSEQAYSGPSFLGEFPEIPTVTQPLVLNCFCTAHCPLKCIYCHADDLMKRFRSNETQQDLENVVSTASMVPAMVAVISGGDPLTQPDRAAFLIRKLADQKALVLDTSGVGDVNDLLKELVDHKVHVRVSLDTLSPANDRLRPPNPAYVSGSDISRRGAEKTIRHCLDAGLDVTVQSVISSGNESESEWTDLRDWLVNKGVRHWVLHVAVKGGSARRIQNAAMKKTRGRGILPSNSVYSKLWRLVQDTQQRGIPLDIRCTDTDTTPNSVFLVGSKGDLYTEGYARNGKVLLYTAGNNRPDLIGALWPHIDRFGHAIRYLNWNPKFYDGKSIETICYDVPLPSQSLTERSAALVETESKYRIRNLSALKAILRKEGFLPRPTVLQRDEYFDTKDSIVSSIDNVVRLRTEGRATTICYKGPRAYAKDGKYSRIEFEVAAGRTVREDLAAKGLIRTWFFEKRRTEYISKRIDVIVAVDEIPELGHYVEIEGTPSNSARIEKAVSDSLDGKETRNYKELFLAFKRQQGFSDASIKGASFGRERKTKR